MCGTHEVWFKRDVVCRNGGGVRAGGHHHGGEVGGDAPRGAAGGRARRQRRLQRQGKHAHNSEEHCVYIGYNIFYT